MPSYRDAQPPGFEITSELRTWETPHLCPRCICGMYAGEKAGFRIEACGRCGGVWLSGEEAKRALALESRAPEELAKKVEAVTRGVITDDSQQLPCPECEGAMLHGRLGNAMIDVCAAHGTWFDRQELHTAMTALRGEPDAHDAADQRALEQMKPSLGNEVQAVAKTITKVIDTLERIVGKIIVAAGD